MNAELKKRIRELQDLKTHSLRGRGVGRNNLKKTGEWTPLDARNWHELGKFVKENMYSHYKYLPPGWDAFNESRGSLCARVRGKVIVPEGLEWEFYWTEVVVGIINKKWIEMRGADRMAVHKHFVIR